MKYVHTLCTRGYSKVVVQNKKKYFALAYMICMHVYCISSLLFAILYRDPTTKGILYRYSPF